MLKIALALIATVVTASFASADDSHGLHLSYNCQDKTGQSLNLSMEQTGSIDLTQQGRTLTLMLVEGTDNTFDATVPCVSVGFARCGAIQLMELQISPELVNKELHGQATFGGNDYLCRMNMM